MNFCGAHDRPTVLLWRAVCCGRFVAYPDRTAFWGLLPGRRSLDRNTGILLSRGGTQAIWRESRTISGDTGV